ncbi:MAG: ABC transporter permease [Chloroflexi bacterium]|nr:ABC transporter permease [Chloroflexota bacterium]
MQQSDARPSRFAALTGPLSTLLSNQAVSLFFILLLLWLVLGAMSPVFFTVNNILQITLQGAVVALVAAGMTFVILSGGIDLSVGSIFAFSAMVTGIAMQSEFGLFGSIAAGLLAGTAVGFLNGFGVARLGLPAFIVTLGMMSIARGGALLLNNGTPIFGLVDGFNIIGQGRIADVIPVPTIIVLVVYLICWFVLRYTPFGRFTYAIGSNPEAARLAGVRVSLQVIGIYMLSGLLTAVAAMVEASRLNSTQPAGGDGLELNAIGAVVIGGTSLFGGEGSIFASLIGALIIATIRNGLTILGISAFWQNVATGAIIILAVYLDRLRRNRQGS